MGERKNLAANPFPLHLEIAAATWSRLQGLEQRLQEAAGITLASLPKSLKPVAKRGQFTVLLTSDAAVRRLNRDFRGKDKPTNVLSFPHFTRGQLVKMGKGPLPKGGVYVGDIAVAYQYTASEAKEEGKLLLDHLTHLVLHGILHIFGYNHETDATAARMERLETKLMAELGLADPYAPVPSRKGRTRA